MTLWNSRDDGAPRRAGGQACALVALAALVALVVSACLGDPFGPRGATPFLPPPALYAAWWAAMERCAQLNAPLARVEWYEVPGDQFDSPEGPRWGWWEPPHAVYLAQGHLLDARLVEHEMLHDLLQTPTHPPLFQACGVSYPNDSVVE